MNLYYTTKHKLKLARWKARRIGVSLRYGSMVFRSVPSVVGNAMPKSGSHLIIQVLQGLTRIGPFVNPGFPPLNRSEANDELPESDVLANIQRMQRGDIAYGYVHCREPFHSALVQPGRASIFVYRDPRDMIISHIFYATEIFKEHGMHQYYTEKLGDMEERINAAILGVREPGAELSSVVERYQAYMGWRDVPEVLCLRFEDLILARETSLNRVLDYLAARGFVPQPERTQAITSLKEAIQPKRSGTFRKGQPGNWREHFTAANIEIFKTQAGQLLVDLGYEKDLDW